jgi:hypothetical protein
MNKWEIIKREVTYVVLLFVQERLSLKLHHKIEEKSLIKAEIERCVNEFSCPILRYVTYVRFAGSQPLCC